MIFHPKAGQHVRINYKDKSLRLQGAYGIVRVVGKGKGPKNVLVETKIQQFEVVPEGNINAI